MCHTSVTLESHTCLASVVLRSHHTRVVPAWAGHDGDLPLITLICTHGGNPNAMDYDNRTCLHLAASEGQVRVVDYLMGLPGIDVNVLDRMGGTPLDDAYRHGRTVVITMLQNAGGMRGSTNQLAAK
eukprot:9303895-Pyramimonas_sp.AAC.1